MWKNSKMMSEEQICKCERSARRCLRSVHVCILYISMWFGLQKQCPYANSIFMFYSYYSIIYHSHLCCQNKCLAKWLCFWWQILKVWCISYYLSGLGHWRYPIISHWWNWIHSGSQMTSVRWGTTKVSHDLNTISHSRLRMKRLGLRIPNWKVLMQALTQGVTMLPGGF